MIREHAKEETLDKIEEAIKPPAWFRWEGAPVGFSTEEDEWAEWLANA